MPDNGSVTDIMIEKLRKDFAADLTAKIVQNAVSNGHLIDVALDRDLVQTMDSS